jgi:CCR4-NOT transcription complex subunit 7/8
MSNSKKRGIHARDLGNELHMSNLVLNDKVTWITFHGQYDFTYLLKVLLAMNLPTMPENFLDYLNLYFPVKYDIKIMINEMEDIKNYSLQKLGNDMCIERHGQQHQGGSDALLTLGRIWIPFKIVDF